MSVPKLSLSDKSEAALAKTRAEVVVVGTVQGPDGLELAAGAEAVDAAFDGTLADVLTTLGATGKLEETVKVPSMGKIPAGVVIAVGLGEPDEVTDERVRRAAGASGRLLAGQAGVDRCPRWTCGPRSRAPLGAYRCRLQVRTG